jgi:hypothetical protein
MSPDPSPPIRVFLLRQARSVELPQRPEEETRIRIRTCRLRRASHQMASLSGIPRPAISPMGGPFGKLWREVSDRGCCAAPARHAALALRLSWDGPKRSASLSVPTNTARSVRPSSQSISSSAKVRVFGCPQNSPIRSVRSGSGRRRTWRRSARAADGRASRRYERRSLCRRGHERS